MRTINVYNAIPDFAESIVVRSSLGTNIGFSPARFLTS